MNELNIRKNSITQIGSRIPTGTSGSVLYIDSNGKLAQSANFTFASDILNIPTIKGSSVSGGNLTLQSTSNATKGRILTDPITITIPTATTTGFIISSAASQSSPVIQINDSSGNEYFSIAGKANNNATFAILGSNMNSNYYGNTGAGISNEYVRGRGTAASPTGVNASSGIVWNDMYAYLQTGSSALVGRWGVSMTAASAVVGTNTAKLFFGSASLEFLNLIEGATASADYNINFTTSVNSGLMGWSSSNDRFYFDDEIILNTSEKHLFRDTGIGIYSQADSYLDVFADGGVRIGNSSTGAPTDYAKFAPDGELTLHGTARVYKVVNVPPSQVALGAAAPSWATINTFRILQFSNVSTQYVHYDFHVPLDWATGTDITVHIDWAPTTGDAGDVVWDIDWKAVAPESNEVISGAGTNATVTDSTQSLQDEFLETGNMTISGASISAGDMISIMLYRDTGDAADTYGALVSMVGIDIEYTSDKLGQSL